VLYQLIVVLVGWARFFYDPFTRGR